MADEPYLTGYADRFAAAPGETIRFMVSAPGAYDARLVELLHGDADPAGPGLRERLCRSDFEGEREGRLQPLHAGSYGIARGPVGDDEQGAPTALTLAVWHLPTRRKPFAQGLLTRWSRTAAGGHGYGLFVLPGGELAVRVGDGAGGEQTTRSERPLELRTWYLAIASIDLAGGAVALHQLPLASWRTCEPPVSARGVAGDLGPVDVSGIPWLLAAHWSDAGRPAGLLDGKLDGPLVLAGAHGRAAVERAASAPGGGDPGAGDAAVLARWDLGAGLASTRIPDSGSLGWELELRNMPARAATGHAWAGERCDWPDAGPGHAAIHFHDDDLEDAGWESDISWTIPADQPPGLYAARLEAADGLVDRIPVLVRTRRPSADVLVVLPTFTYLAYGAERIAPEFDVVVDLAEDRWVTASGLLSQYNHHADGSGVAYASMLRPLPNLRPTHRYWLTGSPHGLGADLYLLDWLRHEGVAYDLLTDDDVHALGGAALDPYRVVLTGSHPEYVTQRQMAAFSGYLDGGGRLMYLGGNGFTMVTGVHPERPHVTEIRRFGSHAGLWDSAPGETQLSTTGELGGHWHGRRERTRELLGVDTVGMGFHGARPFARQPDGDDPRAAFVFDGIGSDEPIGDFGLGFGGAAGYEVDGLDHDLGSPAGALLLARAEGFPDGYVPLSPDPRIRADMTLYETPAGGHVFSVGSITWTASLSHDGYDNNVARITGNVLRRFREPRS